MYNRYRIVNEQDIREEMQQAETYLANTLGAQSGHIQEVQKTGKAVSD
jgi:hypothetical protein